MQISICDGDKIAIDGLLSIIARVRSRLDADIRARRRDSGGVDCPSVQLRAGQRGSTMNRLAGVLAGLLVVPAIDLAIVAMTPAFGDDGAAQLQGVWRLTSFKI